MKQRAALVGYPTKKSSANVVRRPVNVDRFDAMKANVQSDPEAYQRYLNAIMNAIG